MRAIDVLPFDSTSAAGAMLRQVREPLLLGCMLAGFGTSTAPDLPSEAAPWWQCSEAQTTAGARPFATASENAGTVVAVSAGPAIAELRRLSGLTWDQLARLFKVSRRSLHLWANGKAMTSSHEERLQRVLAVVRKIDRGSASENRTLLVGAREDGDIPLDLLAARNYDRVVSLLGAGTGRKAVPPSRLSPEAKAARAPRPPEELVGALQDRIHPTSGRLLAAKPIKLARRK
jgi:DNA-binding transcriptional regulator YiaG